MKTETRPGKGTAADDEIAVGSRAPEASWTRSDGTVVDLRSCRGSSVVLAFFHTDWDPGLEHQLAIFNEALGSLPERIQLVELDAGSDGVRCQVAGEGSAEIPVFHNLDPQSELAKKFGVYGQGAIFVIDAEGFVRYRHVGRHGVFPSSGELVRALNSIPRANLSRRQFVFTAVATLIAFILVPKLRADTLSTPADLTEGLRDGSEPTFTLHVNGQAHHIPADPRITVLDALRDRLGMTGTKKGCDHGQCGACTVHLNGRRVNSCLLLAAQAQGGQITTIEGLAHGDRLHPVQEAFIENDGFQCGYCTPGQIMSAVACIKEGHTKSKEEIREWMSGNICRCGAYQGILEAIEEAKTKL